MVRSFRAGVLLHKQEGLLPYQSFLFWGSASCRLFGCGLALYLNRCGIVCMCLSVCRHRGIFPKKAKPESRGTVFTFSWGICCRKEPVWRVFRQRGPWQTGRGGPEKPSRMPAQGQRGSRSAPQRHPCGSRLVVGRVHIAETPEGAPSAKRRGTRGAGQD